MAPSSRTALVCALMTVMVMWGGPELAYGLERSDPATGAAESQCLPLAVMAARSDFLEFATCKAAQYKLPDQVAHAVIEIESNFKPWVRGGDGEVGLMQVLPSTARLLGFSGTNEELARPEINIHYGVKYLARAWALADQDLCTTVMKYRAGHNETRFSYLSVQYCMRARAIFQRDGYEVVGNVPKATFGFAAEGGGTCLRRSFVPGPGFGRCIGSSSKVSAAKAVAARRSIFGN